MSEFGTEWKLSIAGCEPRNIVQFDNSLATKLPGQKDRLRHLVFSVAKIIKGAFCTNHYDSIKRILFIMYPIFIGISLSAVPLAQLIQKTDQMFLPNDCLSKLY